jgi:hypothetical protein
VNFALDNWLPYGRKARSCVCQPDTVRFVMEAFEQTIEAKRKKDATAAAAAATAAASLPAEVSAPGVALALSSAMQIVPTMIPAIPPATANAEHEKWLLDCVCGIRVDSSDPLSARVGNLCMPNLSHVSIAFSLGLVTFECSKCKNWAHVHCFPSYSQQNPLPEEMFCHHCQPRQPRKRIRIKKDD